MYAVLKDKIVVGFCWETEKKTVDNSCTLVQMTLKNSPAYIGGEYDGNQFYERIDK